MCNNACIDFGNVNLKEEEVRGKSIIEVGSMDVNGSFRPIVEKFKPREYIGVDIQMGNGVDQICKAEDLIGRFGDNRFDVVISTELLEHVKNWRAAIHNIKQILKPGGVLFITTRSKGFGYHGFPFDFWRYEISDMQHIFSDFNIKRVEKDLLAPGVFIKARKPVDFTENDLTKYDLYSILSKRRSTVKAVNYYASILFIIFLPFILLRPLMPVIKKILKSIYKN